VLTIVTKTGLTVKKIAITKSVKHGSKKQWIACSSNKLDRVPDKITRKTSPFPRRIEREAYLVKEVDEDEERAGADKTANDE